MIFKLVRDINTNVLCVEPVTSNGKYIHPEAATTVVL